MRLLAASFVLLMGSAAADPTPPAVARLVLERPLADSPAEIVVCVKVDDQDPSDLLLSSLRRLRKDLIVATECINDTTGTYERRSKRPAMLLPVLAFRITSRSRAEVSVSTYRDGRQVNSEKVEVEQNSAGFWRIVRSMSKSPNSALLTDAYRSPLRAQRGAAKREC